MKIVIVYDSVTGNTKILAKEIQKVLKEKNEHTYLITRQQADETLLKEADLIYVGFWTDKGKCAKQMETILGGLEHKKLGIFGTAGFGGDETYFRMILSNVKAFLPDTAEVVDCYMCQGKMPESVKKKFEAMKIAGVEQAGEMLQNYEQAITHPDSKDLKDAGNFALQVFEKVFS